MNLPTLPAPYKSFYSLVIFSRPSVLLNTGSRIFYFNYSSSFLELVKIPLKPFNIVYLFIFPSLS